MNVSLVGLGLLLPVALGIVWQAAANFGLIDPSFWASPLLVGQAVVAQAQSAAFWQDFGASLWRDAQGTVLGVAVGLPAGLALGLSRTAREYLAPVLDAGKAIPIFTWVPLLSVWTGSGEAGKITFIALAAALPVLFSTTEGVFSLEARHLELGRLLRLGFWVRLRRLVILGAAPGILRGVHLALLFGWLATIGSEYFFESGVGIGTDIMSAREMFALNVIVADMLAIGLVGIALDVFANRLERFVLRWRAA